MAHSKEFQWTPKDFDLKTFTKRYEGSLPLIVFVREGFCGIDEKDENTYSREDEYRISHLDRQPRVIAKDQIGRHISLPLSYPLKFQYVGDTDRAGSAKYLNDLVEYLNAGDMFVAEDDGNTEFWIGAHKKMSIHLGKLEFVAEYKERYLVANLINEGVLCEGSIVIPVYIPIRVALAEGLRNGTPDEFDKLKEKLSSCAKTFERYHVDGNPEIMLFEGKLSEYKDYDYLKPSHYVRCGQNKGSGISTPPRTPPTQPKTTLSKEEDSMVSRLPLVAPPRLVKIPGKQDSSAEAEKDNSLTRMKKEQKEEQDYEFPPTNNPPARSSKPAVPPPTLPKPPSRSIRRTIRREAPPIPESSSDNPSQSASSQRLVLEDVELRRSKIESKSTEITSLHHPYVNNIPRAMVQPNIPLTSVSTEDDKTLADTQNEGSENLYEIIRDSNVSHEQIHNRQVYDDVYISSGANVSRSISLPENSLNNSVQKERLSSTPEQTILKQYEDKVVYVNASEIPPKIDIRMMSIEDICHYLDLLHLSMHKQTFIETDIDGDLLVSILESDGLETLQKDFNFSKTDAMKLMKFVKEGWRPNRSSKSRR